MVTKRVGDAGRWAKYRASRGAATFESYGSLFEPGREDDLRRTLAAKVTEGLNAQEKPASERILSIVDQIISEREGGWHFSLSPKRVLDDLRVNDHSSRLLCADCSLPGCCYFEIVRLTSDDEERLRAHLDLSLEEFVAKYCVSYVDDHDRRYTHALKKAQPCAFLGEDGRCRVYAARPAVCAEFPFVIDRTTRDITEIRLFPFCNVPFNVLRLELKRRALEGII
ncbi:MAG: YkgJ family cysteine cluster protein [Halobacteriota archaeon]